MTKTFLINLGWDLSQSTSLGYQQTSETRTLLPEAEMSPLQQMNSSALRIGSNGSSWLSMLTPMTYRPHPSHRCPRLLELVNRRLNICLMIQSSKRSSFDGAMSSKWDLMEHSTRPYNASRQRTIQELVSIRFWATSEAPLRRPAHPLNMPLTHSTIRPWLMILYLLSLAVPCWNRSLRYSNPTRSRAGETLT